jgi:soluble cytochrome b562
MNRFQSLVLSGVVLLMLASCSSSKQATSPETSAPAAEKPAANGFTTLQTVVNKTQTAVAAGNFSQAKTEFGKFEDTWKTVEDGVKEKSSKTYDAIEENMDNVSKGIKDKSKENTLTALKSLSAVVASAAK